MTIIIVLGRFIGTSQTTKTAIPERVTGGVRFYAILGVGEHGFSDEFLKQKSKNHRII